MDRIILGLALVCAAAGQASSLRDNSQRRESAGAWNYNRCDGENGPDHWGGLCSSIEQSPVNLCGAVDLPNEVTLAHTNYDKVADLTFMKHGEVKLKVKEGTEFHTHAGDLAKQIGRDTSGSSTNPVWKLEQMHMHWGRNGKMDEGSEHFLESVQYPLEAHFVHYNSKYGNVTHAVLSGESDALLVIGQFFEVGDSENDVLKTLGEKLKEGRRNDPEADVTVSVKLEDLMDNTGGFYTYKGSLTTPTCNPVVSWVVKATVLPITNETLASIVGIIRGGEAVSEHGNYRPLQPFGDRTLYKTGGAVTTTRACPSRGVVEADFRCVVDSSAYSLSTGFFLSLVVAAISLVANH